MKNPWLDIPLSDYEGHMSSTKVAQMQTLNELFADALADLRPKSVAVFGCAAGNGFEHIDSDITKRVVGIDINPNYLRVLRDRFSDNVCNLTLVKQNFASTKFSIPPVEMAFAALVFEYIAIEQGIRNISKSLIPGGTLVAALQLPSTASAPVTKTQFSSLETLAPIMTLLEPDKFTQACAVYGLNLKAKRTIPMKQGKVLFVANYKKKLSK